MDDLESQLRRYGSVLDGAEPGVASVVDAAPARMRRATVASFTAVVVLAVVASVVGVVATRSSSPSRPDVVHPSPAPPRATTTVPAAPTTRLAGGAVPQVVAVEVPDGLAAFPFAVAGGDVWVARALHTSGNHVLLDRHDPATGRLLGTIDVAQATVSGIAGDGATLWVAGGGDPTAPGTTVSKVDVRTSRVLFTRTLTGVGCACAVFAGSAGVWLAGNASGDALHLAGSDGHVIARVALPAKLDGRAAIETRGRFVAGLDDGSVAVVDPATNRVERVIPRPPVGDPAPEAIVAMSNASVPAIGPDAPIDAFVARSNGTVDGLSSSTWQVNELAQIGVGNPLAITAVGTRAVIGGGDRIDVATTHAVSSAGFVYVEGSRTFGPATGVSSSTPFGFGEAIAVGNVVWATHRSEASVSASIVVVRIPDNVP